MACILWSIFNQQAIQAWIQATLLGAVTAAFPGTSVSGFSKSPGYPGIRYLCLQWKLGLNSSESTAAPYTEGQFSLGHLICHNPSPRNSCKVLVSPCTLWCGQAHHLTQVLCWHSGHRQTQGPGLGAEGTATLPSSITQQAAVQEFTQPILTAVTRSSEVILFWNRFFQSWKRAQEVGTGDLTLPVFAVSASIIFQEFFSAGGFCSSAVLLCCWGFPVSLLYVEELLSCLFEDINFLILAWHRRSATSQLGFDSPQLQVSGLHSYGDVPGCHHGARGSSGLPPPSGHSPNPPWQHSGPRYPRSGVSNKVTTSTISAAQSHSRKKNALWPPSPAIPKPSISTAAAGVHKGHPHSPQNRPLMSFQKHSVSRAPLE